MEYLIICTVSLFVSGLTLFSGFGLGTLLMPAFALFFPVPVAIAVTAVVHLANNLFKVVLVGRTADWSVVLRFALPGAMAAMVGASVLTIFTHFPPIFHYQLAGRIHRVGAVELMIGILIVGFAMLDLMPRFSNVGFDRKYLVVGGALSGFLGGISGIQGAMRSAFLIKAGLEKEAFIGTSTVSAVIVDLARLVVYGVSFNTIRFTASANMGSLMLAAIVAAFAGSFVGARLLKKVTMRMIQIVVGALLIVVGCGIATGLF
jgi:hypothetical protein